ncbi:DUF736 domain-containing protein [Mesorhizobium loti]|nr:DUF736 domain-containing protein [Mesorhizobium loti]PLP60817.1 DUF736 domain-containing protein [Mesorhizobium loti]
MTQIGTFTRTRSGYQGQIQTLTLKRDVLVVATGNDAAGAPDYRIHADSEEGPEIGAGWKRSSQKAGEYISVTLEDPALARPIHAILFQNGDDKSSWSMHWSRQRDRGGKE